MVYSDRTVVFFLFHLPTGGKKNPKRNRLFKRLKYGMVAFWSFSLCVSLFFNEKSKPTLILPK